MDDIDQYFRHVEEMHHIPGDSKHIQRLRKVLSDIVELDDIPQDAKYNLRRRAMQLSEKLQSPRGESLNRVPENGISDAPAKLMYSNGRYSRAMNELTLI